MVLPRCRSSSSERLLFSVQLEFVDESMDESKKIIGNMARRVATNRCILAGIILLLLGACALIIYLSWFP